MDIISRSAANLPAPPSSLTQHTGSWPGITWHHTGGTYTTWRNIYDWQVVNRPADKRLPYVGYSYGIANGRVTELRGWNLRPAGDHDNDRLQVCFMGTWDSRLPPAEDLAAAVEFLRWAEARNGRPLPGVAHRDVWPSGHQYDTDCPGDALYAWVTKTLPTIGEDMTPEEHNDLVALASRLYALLLLDPTKANSRVVPAGQLSDVPLIATIKQLVVDVAELKGRPPVVPAPVDPAAVKAALLDPEFLAAVAKAVNDEDHARSAG